MANEFVTRKGLITLDRSGGDVSDKIAVLSSEGKLLETSLNVSDVTGSNEYDLKLISSGDNVAVLQLSGSNNTLDNIAISGSENEIEVTKNVGTGLITIGLPDNVTIAGDLTVQGTTTTIDSTEVSIGDRIIYLNAANAGGDSGIQVADADNTTTGSLLWDTGTELWTAGAIGSELHIARLNDLEGGTYGDFKAGDNITLNYANNILEISSSDSYGGWNYKVDSNPAVEISSGETLTFTSGPGITLDTDTNEIIISSSASPNLQTVTDEGNTTTNSISVRGLNVSSSNDASQTQLSTTDSTALGGISYEDIVTVPNCNGAWFDYYVADGNGVSRTGTVIATKNNTNTVSYTDTSVDQGDSISAEFQVVYDSGTSGLKLQGQGSGFTAKVFARGL